MIELLVLIIGVVILYRFRHSAEDIALGTESHTQIWVENQLLESAHQRIEIEKKIDALITDHKQIPSHNTIMNKLIGE